MFTCVIHFLFIRCEVYLLFFGIFFSPASQLVELKYWCILQVTQCGKHLRNVIHLLKEQNTLLSQKRKKKKGVGGEGVDPI